MIKEACIGSYREGIKAWKQGADRLELCENLAEGGTTPSYGTVKTLLEDVDIPVVVMIRPRGGDFTYSTEEVGIMIEDIRLLKTLDIDGFVLGVLTKEDEIDYPVLEKLMEETKGYKVTFHKAIDEVKNPIKDIEKLSKLRVARILTSGCETTAIEGKNLLNEMIQTSNGLMENKKIVIVSAGRITKENIKEVSSIVRGNEFHGKLIVGKL